MLRSTLYDKVGSYKVHFPAGSYLIECWGASGGNERRPEGGRGAYVSGVISFLKPIKLFLYVGERGTPLNTSETFNGGGGCFFDNEKKKGYGSSGGGASDVRLIGGEWHWFNSLKSRIIVASGGGGEVDYYYDNQVPIAGAAGGIETGFDGSYSQCIKCQALYGHNSATGGTQQSGGSQGGTNQHFTEGNPGEFGKGGTAKSAPDGWASSGGGGGYFGGGSGGVTYDCLGSGAGGSSFVSGGDGFSAITEGTEPNDFSFSGNIHYSKHFFINIHTKSGQEEIHSPSGDIEIGHTGDGAIRITNLSYCTYSYSQKSRSFIYLFTFIFLKH